MLCYVMLCYGMVWYGMVWYGMYVCMYVCVCVRAFGCEPLSPHPQLSACPQKPPGHIDLESMAPTLFYHFPKALVSMDSFKDSSTTRLFTS